MTLKKIDKEKCPKCKGSGCYKKTLIKDKINIKVDCNHIVPNFLI